MIIVRVRVTYISEEGPVSILCFPSILKTEAVCSSETLLPVPTYQTTRLPVPQECIILRAYLNLEFSARFAITLSYSHPITTN
jgi:hypothetical protein